MKVYQIHFVYSPAADDRLFYYGSDYNMLYANKEKAEQKAKELFTKYQKDDYSEIVDYRIYELEVII